MGKLIDQLREKLLPGMYIPEPLEKLYEWIEAKGFYEDIDGLRVGYLFDQDQMRESWTDTERLGGTLISFAAEGNEIAGQWLGNTGPEVMDRLCVFCNTEGEHSMAAFWLDEEDKQQIVHMGSGCGADWVGVITDDMVDFLRLIAIGYDEVSAREVFPDPVNVEWEDHGLVVHPNVPFREWVQNTFHVEIPLTGSEIVKKTAGIDDEDSDEPFQKWCGKVSG